MTCRFPPQDCIISHSRLVPDPSSRILAGFMEWAEQLLWPGGRFLGIEWSTWKVVGWMGNAVFTSRFIVQWYASERQGRVVIPTLFWWLSLSGSLLLLAYSIFHKRDSVLIAAYGFSWIPYLRNLYLHRRSTPPRQACPACRAPTDPGDRFCSGCGVRLPTDTANVD
jgi:lipid-A-disaccharide synthase-like uncharacterized protein